MPLFHRGDDETLNEKLLREAGYSAEGSPLEKTEEREPDDKTVFWLDEPELAGSAYDFVTLADGSVIVDEDAPDVSGIAEAVEQDLEPPYQVSAAKQSDGLWLVTAEPIEVETLALGGDELELTSLDGVATFRVDGAEVDAARVPSRLAQIGARTSTDYVVQAERLDGDLWKVRADSL